MDGHLKFNGELHLLEIDVAKQKISLKTQNSLNSAHSMKANGNDPFYRDFFVSLPNIGIQTCYIKKTNESENNVYHRLLSVQI